MNGLLHFLQHQIIGFRGRSNVAFRHFSCEFFVNGFDDRREFDRA
jgi:hypothetical protein